MADIDIDYGAWLFFGGRGARPLAGMRNGIAPSAYDRRGLANALNLLLGARKKVLGQHITQTPEASISAAGDAVTLRLAGHTGPLTSKLRCVHTCMPPAGAPGASDPRGYWQTETGLTGAGTVATRDAFRALTGTGANIPDNYAKAVSEFTVSADTDYRLELHVVDGMRIFSTTVYELLRLSYDPDVDTDAADPRGMVFGAPVYDAAEQRLFAAAQKYFKRGQPSPFNWSVDGTTAYTRTTNTYANLLDQTVTTYSAYGAAAPSPGWIVYPRYKGTVDDATVNAVFWCYAGVSAGTGNVLLRTRQGVGLATIVVTGAAAWRTTTCTLAASELIDKLDVSIAGPGGADTLSIYQAGAFLYTS